MQYCLHIINFAIKIFITWWRGISICKDILREEISVCVYVCVLVYVRFSHVWLCDIMDCIPPGTSVHGILQAKILEWVAMSSSGNLPAPGIEPALFCLLYCQVGSFPLAPPGKLVLVYTVFSKGGSCYERVAKALGLKVSLNFSHATC